ncbi:MAG: dienelactone hydrolase family protein [Anaerolineae bacterium]
MIVLHETIYTDTKNVTPLAYLVRPDDDRVYPGVVLIQEWWGVEPHIMELAERMAREGFVVMVPDLYHGKVSNEPDDAQKLVMALTSNMERAIGEIVLALEYLRNNAGVQPKKLGLMGFCMGGYLTFKTAEQYPYLGAISPGFGGRYNPTPEDVAKIKAPVLAVYGELDGGIPVEGVRKVEQMYKDAGKPAEFHIYANAGHAFLNPTHGAYVEGPAKDAWARAIQFFKKNLA